MIDPKALKEVLDAGLSDADPDKIIPKTTVEKKDEPPTV